MNTFYVKRPGRLWRLAAVGVIALHVACASAQQETGDAASVVAGVIERYPAGSIQTAESADAALAAVAGVRADINARFAAEEQVCHPKFFATSCVDDAKERRRLALLKLRKVELEANAFKRRERVAEREKAEAERQARGEADRQERLREAGESKVTEGSAPQEKAEAADDLPRPASNRQAKHEARIKRLEEEDRVNAQKRAENAANYEKKVRDAQERQKEVAQRKAEREEKHRAKQESGSGAQ